MLEVVILAEKKTNLKVILAVIVCITILEIVALCNGINGILLTGVIATLAGIGGLTLPTPKILKL